MARPMWKTRRTLGTTMNKIVEALRELVDAIDTTVAQVFARAILKAAE